MDGILGGRPAISKMILKPYTKKKLFQVEGIVSGRQAIPNMVLVLFKAP